MKLPMVGAPLVEYVIVRQEDGIRYYLQLLGVAGSSWSTAVSFALRFVDAFTAATLCERHAECSGACVRMFHAPEVDLGCKACKHCYMEPSNMNRVCGHPASGGFGKYTNIVRAPDGHCGPLLRNFSKHPNRADNGDLL